jgi:SAM-dependent methyltransferase
VDHLDTPSLREKYVGHDVNVDDLVHVNGVWGEKRLAETAAAVAPVDSVVASHVIEHVPDLVAFLQEVAAVLKPTGDLRLAIPDRRYTFDLLRTETVLADVLAAYLVRARIPQARQMIDQVANAVRVNCHELWEGTFDRTALVKFHNPSDIERLARDVIDNGHYHDLHCWIFTPVSFIQLMLRLAELGYHRFKCVKLFDTEPYTNEFIVIARLAADQAEAIASWRVLHEEFERAAARNEEVERLQARVASLERTIDEITRSTSWRITAPMRALKGVLNGAPATVVKKMDARRAEQLYKKADAGRWKVPPGVLSDALERSAEKAFAGRSPSDAELDRYFSALHPDRSRAGLRLRHRA